LYDNNIANTIFISGDSHANWVSDLVWLDHHPYDPHTGNGSIGVEFAGSAVSSPSPGGQNISIANSRVASQWLVQANRELQWSELYYRGYFELHISKAAVQANYFGMPTIVDRNPHEIPLANFTVQSGANKLQRFGGTVVASPVENGYVKFGSVKQTNITNSTDVAGGFWFVSHNNTEDI
jgi:alkaline phosphatase D